MSANMARKPEVELKIDKESRILTSLAATIRTGDYPGVNISHHPDKRAETQALKMSSSDVAYEVGERQKVIFNPRTTPDVDLSVREPFSGVFEFKGFLCNPRYAFSAYNVAVQDQAMAEYTKLEALNYSIYEFAKPDTELNVKLESAQSIPKFIKKILEELVKNGPAEEGLDEQGKKDRKAQHAINSEGHKIFMEILDASEDTFGWKEIVQQMASMGDTQGKLLKARICEIFFSATGSFLLNMQMLCDEFQVIYIPEWDKPGKFVNRTKIFQEPEVLKLEPVAMAFSGGSQKGLFPVRYVSVAPMFRIVDTELKEDKKRTETPFILCPEPDDFVVATSMRHPGPLWLDYDKVNSIKLEKDPASNRSMDLKKKQQAREEHSQDVKKHLKSLDKILYSWGMSIYAWSSLAGSVATIEVPLDFYIELGKRYEIQNKDGEKLFSGFLVGITHNIVVNNQGQALTTLDFSHIMAGDFELPGLDEMK